MQSCDVLIVGGGPAGSTCAWRLRAAGLEVLVLDQATFPRPKVCAGWVTPPVFQQLRIDPADYGRGRVLQPFTAFRTGCIGGGLLQTDYGRPVSFGIRRSEFDEYLLARSGANLQLGEPAKTIERRSDGWLINGRFQARMLVAAGGHFCPVARLLGTAADAARPLVAAEEIEFQLSPSQQAECPVAPEIPEIYFCDDLQGYGWCVRKGNFLNVGLGREDRRRIAAHVRNFCDCLRQKGTIPPDTPGNLRGHAYFLYPHSPRKLLDDGVLAIGDAAGLAYPESGEGIRPAIESAQMAAAVIVAAAGDYRAERLAAYCRMLEARFGRRQEHRLRRSLIPAWLRRLLGRRLLGNRWLTRRVLLDRWFLHADQAPLEIEGVPG
jgi:flavin-dependent dehydrogenase